MANAIPDSMREYDLFVTAFARACLGLGVAVSETATERMWQHFMLLRQANQRFNLTRITSVEDAAVKHYADALTLLKVPGVDREADLNVLDVGTGGGLPAVPLAVQCPRWSLRAIDGTGKKVRFVGESAETMGLVNLSVQHARAQQLATEQPGEYDLVVLRAVGKLDACLKEVAPLVAGAGRVVFYKSAQLSDAERHDGDRSASRCGFRPGELTTATLTGGPESIDRQLVSYRRD